MTSSSDPHLLAVDAGPRGRQEVHRALLGWALHTLGAACLYLFFAPIFGTMVAWKVAWAVAIVLAAGIAFRAGHWFQRGELRRRAGRKVRRCRAPWGLLRCLAMLFSGTSFFAIGWAQALLGYNANFPMGAMMGWTIFVGSGAGMMFVGGWELHRRLHGSSAAAFEERQRGSETVRSIVWMAVALAAVMLAMTILGWLPWSGAPTVPGYFRIVMAFIILGVVGFTGYRISTAASRKRESPRGSRRWRSRQREEER